MSMNFECTNTLTPAEYARFLFEHTNQNGILSLPKNFGTEDEQLDQQDEFILSWDEKGLERLIQKFEALYAELEQIAKVYDKLDGDCESVRLVLGSQRLFDTWYTYIRDWELEGLDEATVSAVEKGMCLDCGGETLSQEETALYEQYYDAYVEARDADCKRRIGTNIRSFLVIIYAKRLCKLLSLQAPEIVVQNEARLLIQNMALHEFATTQKIMR